MRTDGTLYLELVSYFVFADFIDFDGKYTVLYVILPQQNFYDYHPLSIQTFSC